MQFSEMATKSPNLEHITVLVKDPAKIFMAYDLH